MKKILIFTIIATLLFSFCGCAVDKSPVDTVVTEAEQDALDAYIGAFGHVRTLGDLDHILKGDMDTTMKLDSAISFNETKTELTFPLVLEKYDYDGHRNPEDPDPEKYTRIATGTLDLVLVGAMNAEGTGFVANGYKMLGVDVTLDCDTTEYILLDLPTMEIEAEELDGIFTTAGGVARATLTITVADGKATGIADVNTPKFGTPSGDFTVNGKTGAVL